MNRTRRLLAGIGRGLAERGIGSWLPDLPGTGDSDARTETMGWDRWGEALAAVGQQIGEPHLLAVRGGALLTDVPGRSAYLLAPVDRGERLLRELTRARAAADREAGGEPLDPEAAWAAGETIELAGYPISPDLADALRRATRPTPAVATRIASVGDGDADIAFEGPLVWRQAEPLPSDSLAAAIAGDAATWIASCAAR